MGLKLDDLLARCDACGGTGRRPGPAGGPRERPCEECRGVGGTVTEAGRAVLEFLRVLKDCPELGGPS